MDGPLGQTHIFANGADQATQLTGLTVSVDEQVNIELANTGSDAVSRNFIMLLVVHNGDGGLQLQQSQLPYPLPTVVLVVYPVRLSR